MAAHIDPWAATDHDPTSQISTAHHSVVITTARALTLARADICDAVATTGHNRRQYAQAAREYATIVLLADDATEDQRRHARYYLVDAEVLATSNPHIAARPVPARALWGPAGSA